MQNRIRLSRLAPAAWIAVVGTVAGVVAFAWYVSQIPFSTFDAGSAFGLAFGMAFTGAAFFVPQFLIVVLFATTNRGARVAGVVLGGLAALAGIAMGVMWVSGAQFEGQSYDLKALGLWLPLVVMGIIDGVAAAVAWLGLRHDHTPTLQPTATA